MTHPKQSFQLDIPKNWDLIPLRYVVNGIEAGNRDASFEPTPEDSGVLSIGGEHFDNKGEWQLESPRYIPTAMYEDLQQGKIINGDTLLVKDGATIGKAAYVNSVPEGQAAVNSHVYVLKPSSRLHDKLLAYNLWSSWCQSQIKSLTRGSAQAGLPSSFSGEVLIPVPPTDDQVEIVEFLDESMQHIDALIEKKNELMGLLDEKRQVIIHRAVIAGFDGDRSLVDTELPWPNQIPSSWSLKPLRAVVDRRNEMNSPIEETRILSVVRGKGVIRYEDRGASGNKATDDLEKYQIVQDGDIVANRLNLLIGSSGIAHERGICSPEYIVLNPNEEEIHPKYISYIFVDNSFLKWLARHGKGIQDLRERVYYKDLRSEQIPVPPRKEQEKIVNRLEQELEHIDDLTDSLSSSIELLSEKREALITNAVTGQLAIDERKPEIKVSTS